ncbi:MAG: hypothetical protein WD599_03585 [Balneolaceae bacterium]
MTDIDLSFQEAEGLIRLSGNKIIFEYLIKDALGFKIRSDTRIIHLPLVEIENLEIINWWVTLRLVISLKTIKVLDEFPIVESGRIKLKISRKHKKILEEFVSNTRLALTEIRLDKLKEK